MAEADPSETDTGQWAEGVDEMAEVIASAQKRYRCLNLMTWLGCVTAGGLFGVWWEKIDNDHSLKRADLAVSCRGSMTDRYILQQRDRECLSQGIGADKIERIYDKDDLREYADEQSERSWTFDIEGLLIKTSLGTACSSVFMAAGAHERREPKNTGDELA